MTTTPIKLVISGLSHVPSMKNSKMLTRGRLITKPEYQKWMGKCIDNFVSQLWLKSQTEGCEISTVLSRLSLIALSMPEDDSCRIISEINVRFEEVNKGEEGAEITIEPICNQNST